MRIYRPAPPSTQSAKCSSHSWVIDWDILQGAGRWENPLMGWASTADYMQATNLKFGTREQAVAFCERQGESGSLFDELHGHGGDEEDVGWREGGMGARRA